ncbi:MAG: LLM class flavin-dependent oxidoreductase [Pseudomonadota bacterium]|nr:LLM class flavin-dependent oxidoreductase [Pseudomonadota bacterium]
MTVLSVLDLSPIVEGGDVSLALANTLDLARHTEELGYHRYWVAEHHNMRGIASAATSVVIGHIAGGTDKIRVGAGGIMLPNHAPIMVAEQFGTLEALYPGRIDLGLGRAPGTDGMTAQALRRTLNSDPNKFPQDVVELQRYLQEPEPNQQIYAVPGYGANVPIYILGSSLFGAQLAAILGLPFAFASHFAPQAMTQALEIYRREFQPSDQLKEPYVILGYNICAADSQEHAEYIRTSSLQAFINLRFGNPGPLPPPVKDFEKTLNAQQEAVLSQVSSASSVGTVDKVCEETQAFIENTGADELIIVAQVYHHQDRRRSYELAMEALR